MIPGQREKRQDDLAEKLVVDPSLFLSGEYRRHSVEKKGPSARKITFNWWDN